jgi:hypothetical protein
VVQAFRLFLFFLEEQAGRLYHIIIDATKMVAFQKKLRLMAGLINRRKFLIDITADTAVGR